MKLNLTAAPIEIRHRLPPLPALTSIRFFAALYVVLFHFELQNQLLSFPVLRQFILSGYTGVTLFFALSGFILAYNYSVNSSSRQFWIARFARVYPVYLLALCICLARELSSPFMRSSITIRTTLLSLALLQSWFPSAAFVINGPGWTLSVEAFFYAVFPLVVRLAQRLRLLPFLLIQAAYLVFVALPLVLSSYHHMAPAYAWASGQFEGAFPLFRLNTFFVGAWAGAQYRLRVTSSTVPSGASPSRPTLQIAALIAGVIASVVLLCANPSVVARGLHTQLLTYSYTLILLGLAGSQNRLLSSHWLQMGGEISYGMYILQIPIGIALVRLLRPLQLGPLSLLAGIVAGLIVTSYVVFRWFEIPARLLIRRTLTGRPTPTRPI